MSLDRDITLDNSDPESLGVRLRTLRERRRLSLTNVASRAELSASFLSQLERGKCNASFGSLRKIAAALGVSLAELFEDDEPTGVRVLAKGDRPQLASGPARKYMLSLPPLTNLECFVGEFDPGASTGPEPYTHGDSQELFLVLRGEVSVEVDGKGYLLGAGDSVEYRSSQPHRTYNNGAELAEVLWIVSPVTVTD